MKDSGSASGAGRAFNALFSDMVERLLAASDNPAKASAYIAETLRALFGARTVLVFKSTAADDLVSHRLVSVYPERRKDIASRPGMEQLLSQNAASTKCRIAEAGDASVEGEALRELGCASAVIAPLAYGNQLVGSLVLIDLFDLTTMRQVIDPIERLSSIFALVLRNGDLFSHLEEEVAERTRQLEDRSLKLQASLREKDILLKEINHRVKNNLQVIISLLYLKASSFVEGPVRAALEDSQSRIYSMALVHEELYRTGNFETIDMGEYARRLVDRILDSCCEDVDREYRLAPLSLPLDKAVPCGLILCELVMNAAKHAFNGKTGTKLTLGIALDGEEAVLEVADDGPGIPEDSSKLRADSVGLLIVDSLVEQLHARLETKNEGGATFRLRFSAG